MLELNDPELSEGIPESTEKGYELDKKDLSITTDSIEKEPELPKKDKAVQP